jgi:hypothetical protein
MKTVILYLIVILNSGNDYELRRIISYEELTCFNWYEKNIIFLDNNSNKYNDLYVSGYICQYQKEE